MGCVRRLLPLPALHSYALLPPVVDDPVHGNLVAQGIIFAVEEEGRCSDLAVVETIDAVVVIVCCVRFKEPEVKQGSVFDKALESWHQSLAKA